MANPAPMPLGGYIPATPVAGTGFAGNLVSYEFYQQFTKDLTSSADAIESTIALSTTDLAKRLNRTLLFGQFTEMLYVYKLGYVYPSATPIVQVDAPIDADIQGSGVWIGFYLPLPEMPVWSGVIPPQSQVTYWGGFDDSTVIPRLAELICKVSWYRLNQQPFLGMPGGIVKAQAGPVAWQSAVSISQLMVSDRGIKADIEALERKQPHGWQS